MAQYGFEEVDDCSGEKGSKKKKKGKWEGGERGRL
jgi:hypothetical protein